jgi:ABC-type polysaccharide/polyol phosphate transport system ATPase subunit
MAPDKEIDAKLEEILEFSGLKQFQDAKLKNPLAACRSGLLLRPLSRTILRYC